MSTTTSRQLVKVKVAFTVTVDAEAWATEYGTEETAAEIRKDVNTYVRNGAYDHFNALGLLAEPEGE